jgi:hypothetical protein
LIATVNVRDRIAPTARLKGLEEMEVEVFGTFNDPGVDATDNYYPNVTIQTTSTLNMNVLGVYTITYNVCDAANNCVTLTRTVRVVDKTAPVIVLLGGNPIEINRYSNYQEPGFVVNDNYYAPSSFSVNVNTSEIINHIPGIYYVYYKTIDGSGNAAAEVTRLVSVIDITTGVNEVKSANGISIFPNPVEDGEIHIISTQTSISKVGLVDLLGKSIYMATDINKKDYHITTDKIKNGIYFVTVTTADGKQSVQKISIR